MRVTVAGSDVAARARTNSVHIVHRCLHLGEDGVGIEHDSGPRLRQRGPAVRFVRGAAEGEAGEAAEPLKTCGRNEEKVRLTYRAMVNKRLITANYLF